MLIRGKYVLCNPDIGGASILENAAVYIEGDKIGEVGEFTRLKEKYPQSEVLGNGEQLVMPGFIDGHSHGGGLTPLQSGTGYDFLEKWLLDLALNTNIDPYLNACYSAVKHIESGCTTMHHYHSTKDPAHLEEEIEKVFRGYQDAGIRLAFSLGVKDQNRFTYDDDQFAAMLPPYLREKVDPVMRYDQKAVSEQYFSLFDHLYRKYNGEGRKIFFGPMAPQWCSDELLRSIQEKARNYNNARVHLHVLQTVLQKAYGHRKYGKSLVKHLDEIGLMADNVTFGHAIWLTEEDLATMAATGTSVTHHASCNLNMRNGIQPVAALKKAGVLVAIGIDDKGLNDDEDYIQEMRLIHKLHRVAGFSFDTPTLSGEDVIKMGTVNAAFVTGFAGIIGTLEAGKKADLILVNLEKVMEPWMDPRVPLLEAFIHRTKGTDVDTVIIDGKVVMQERQIMTIDKDDLFAEIARSASKGLTPEQQRYASFLNELRPYYNEFYQGWHQQHYDPYYALNSRN
ncbi:hypothetical protein SY88_15840 [Clostridiales bacterium PH28_bin88]|nr:hypothetical protein SY88_15840 [Clostridiales bacterium PH28_bin88]